MRYSLSDKAVSALDLVPMGDEDGFMVTLHKSSGSFVVWISVAAVWVPVLVPTPLDLVMFRRAWMVHEDAGEALAGQLQSLADAV